MNDFLMWLGGIIATGLFSLIGWVFKMVFDRIDTLGNKHEALAGELDTHKLYAANHFVTKVDIRNIRDEVVRHLERIENKLDRKADKQ